MSASYGRMWAARWSTVVDFPEHDPECLRREYVFVRTIYNRHFCFCRSIYESGAVLITAKDMTQDQHTIHTFSNFSEYV